MRKITKSPDEKIVKDINRATWKHYPSEKKIRIGLDGLRDEYSIAELCLREGIALTFSNLERYFVSETILCRSLEAHDLVTRPAFNVLKVENEFQHKTTAINHLW